jgi:hypothetical protein
MKLGVLIPLGNTPRAFFDFCNLTYFAGMQLVRYLPEIRYFRWQKNVSGFSNFFDISGAASNYTYYGYPELWI